MTQALADCMRYFKPRNDSCNRGFFLPAFVSQAISSAGFDIHEGPSSPRVTVWHTDLLRYALFANNIVRLYPVTASCQQ